MLLPLKVKITKVRGDPTGCSAILTKPVRLKINSFQLNVFIIRLQFALSRDPVR